MSLVLQRVSRATGLSALACAALTVSGCGVSQDVMASIGMPASDTASAELSAPTWQPPAALTGKGPNLVVTPAQRAYLDAIVQAGIHPASDLSALSIGSYVCQARAADQSDQEMWDFVLPMVRGDVRDSHGAATAPPAGQVNSATADYIRIATDHLC